MQNIFSKLPAKIKIKLNGFNKFSTLNQHGPVRLLDKNGFDALFNLYQEAAIATGILIQTRNNPDHSIKPLRHNYIIDSAPNGLQHIVGSGSIFLEGLRTSSGQPEVVSFLLYVNNCALDSFIKY